ncbi:MAG TPA: hypothetical protein VGX25_23630 [Actinophytocola sp.]|uniref:hypothetical protein n=1 Tax=Actinophytocola sp. TaxID=1872138 RepID=UPI002DDDA577|nr:hypothetical protein [Actinophytocola sp.]HEV2782395.1 hypothetical protein [Actinophytocola sp.]
MDHGDGDGLRRRSELRLALQKLAQGRGVQRKDLVEALGGELGELRRHWGLNLTEPGIADRSRLRSAVRDAIVGNLRVHVENLTPPRGKSPRTYAHAVLVSFNALLDPAHAYLEDSDITARREWLASEQVPESYRVNARTSRRYLNHAIDQIVQQILAAGHEPVQRDVRAGDDGAESRDTADRPEPDTAPRARMMRRPRSIVVATGIAAVTVLTAALVIIDPFKSAARDPISIQLSPIDFSTGQIASPDLVVPEDLASLEQPPVYDDQEPAPFEAWVKEHRGVRAERLDVNFLARSGLAEPTVIVNVRVEVVRREPPMRGTRIVPPVGGGGQPIRQLYVDLDTTPPKITKGAEWDFPLRISQVDPEGFSVRARTQRCHCYWVIELDLLLPSDELQVVKVDNNGAPFELTSIANTTGELALPKK